MGGAIGLDYQALPVVAKYLEVAEEDMPLAFNDIRLMESEALSNMAKGRDK